MAAPQRVIGVTSLLTLFLRCGWLMGSASFLGVESALLKRAFSALSSTLATLSMCRQVMQMKLKLRLPHRGIPKRNERSHKMVNG